MQCEMCSSKPAVVKADVEGAKLNVCEQCSRYGKILGRIALPVKPGAKKAVEASAAKATESIQVIKSDYYRLIKNAREKMGLTQEDFAKKMMERESLLHKIESGHMKPDISLARKLEKVLKIVLVEQLEVEAPQPGEKKKSEGMTLGDLIKIK